MEPTKNNKVILVPTDFSKVGDSAIEHAAGIAKILNCKVCITHVINKDTKSLLKKDKMGEVTVFQKLSMVVRDVEQKYKVKAEYMAREGSIFSTISEIAEEIKATMIVIGTHGKIGVQHLIGSYALKVITSSSVPVIVVQKRAFDKGYNDIVLPLDDSLESKQKLKWAIHIARIFNSKIHIFAMKHNDELISSKINNNLAQIKSILTKNKIKHTVKISEKSGGNFAKQAIAYANSIRADLVVIMTNPEQLLPSFMLGPWDEAIIFNAAQIPVLCVNPRDFNITILGL